METAPPSFPAQEHRTAALVGYAAPCRRAKSAVGACSGSDVEQGLEDLGRVLDAISHVWGVEFAQFQFDAVLDALRASWFSDDRDATGLVITAGTGFGKTLGFMIPVLTDALIQTRDAQRRAHR